MAKKMTIRKFTNDQLRNLYNTFKRTNSISRTAKKHKLKYEDAYYRLKEFERRKKNGEYDITQTQVNTKNTKVSLLPFMIRYKNVDEGLKDLNDMLTSEQMTAVTMLYNTIIFEADCVKDEIQTKTIKL